MFDDPRKELQRLQEELLAEDAPEIGEYEEDLTEGFEEFFDDESDEDDEHYRNYANGYGEFEEEEEYLDDDAVFYQ